MSTHIGMIAQTALTADTLTKIGTASTSGVGTTSIRLCNASNGSPMVDVAIATTAATATTAQYIMKDVKMEAGDYLVIDEVDLNANEYVYVKSSLANVAVRLEGSTVA